MKNHSWYLCQISLQIMLLPIQNEGNLRDVYKETNLAETTGTKIKRKIRNGNFVRGSLLSLRKHPFLLALRRRGRFARPSPSAKSEEKRMFSQAILYSNVKRRNLATSSSSQFHCRWRISTLIKYPSSLGVKNVRSVLRIWGQKHGN